MNNFGDGISGGVYAAGGTLDDADIVATETQKVILSELAKFAGKTVWQERPKPSSGLPGAKSHL